MKTIRFERDGKVGNIILANPPYNRLDSKFAVGIREAVREASECDIRVVIIRAEGPNFSLGGEVREWPGAPAPVYVAPECYWTRGAPVWDG
jgi:enoyl-CoA hydratase/carnithine racemase